MMVPLVSGPLLLYPNHIFWPWQRRVLFFPRYVSSKLGISADELGHRKPYVQGRSHLPQNRARHITLSRLKDKELIPGMEGQDDSKVIGKINRSRKMIFMPILEEGVYRFDCGVDARKDAFPSLSFLDPKARDSSLEDYMHKVPDYIPFCESLHGQQVVTIELPCGSSLYGTGEVSGSFERTGKRVFAWNTDAWGYGPGTTSLYQSHPWVLAILPNGESYGVLADTTRRCEIDLRRDSTMKFVAPAAYPVITFGPFASATAVLTSLFHAIGNVFMPPKWSLGYHQCRWSYDTETRVMEVAKLFREKQIPCDVIWMDIDYMHGFRCFTFDPERFPDPRSLARNLHKQGFKAVWMLDPGIQSKAGYFAYDSGCSNDVWIQKANGKPFVGKVWPGECVFPDFTQAKARTWWAKLVCDFVSNGVDGIWNDMNEPAVFKSVTKTMPESNIHRGDEELGGSQKHSHYHNVYGMLMARSTYEGMLLANPQKRPFVLTRAGYIGSQRYAATWTGDNLSNWEHLHMSISMVLNLGLSGQPLSGPDIGGFAGDATPRLFARWMGIGTMLPFCRCHSESATVDHEPWAFGKECEEVCRLAIKRRYIFIPHLYTLFYLAHTEGKLVAAPLFMADSKDPNLRHVEDAFLLGPLLVSASTVREKSSNLKETILPKGIWRRFDFEDTHPELPLLYLQGGSIIPVGPCIQHVDEAKPTDTVTLLVALDGEGKAKGVLFEDAGDGYEYCQGKFLLTYYEAELLSSVVFIKVTRTEGLWKRPMRKLHVQLLLGEDAKLEAWGLDGEEVRIEIPSAAEVAKLMAENQKQNSTKIAHMNHVPDDQEHYAVKGAELSETPVDLKSGEWHLKIVPLIGGRIISMVHVVSDTQWLHSRVEIGGYEEYSGVEYRSAGCSEKYTLIKRDLQQPEEQESMALEGDIGGGLVLQREISVSKSHPKVVCIESSIIAKHVGAGSGGFSRLVCLRVHPTFTLVHPMEVCIKFTSVDGTDYEISPEIGENLLQANARPNGEWMLVDKCAGLALVNRFNVNEVAQCLIHWDTGTCNLELWSEERPVSKDTPLRICHEYEVIKYQTP